MHSVPSLVMCGVRVGCFVFVLCRAGVVCSTPLWFTVRFGLMAKAIGHAVRSLNPREEEKKKKGTKGKEGPHTTKGEE